MDKVRAEIIKRKDGVLYATNPNDITQRIELEGFDPIENRVEIFFKPVETVKNGCRAIDWVVSFKLYRSDAL